MKQILISCLLLLSVAGFSQKKQAPLKWQQMFNGKDLTNWTIKIKDHKLNENFGNTFRVTDGLLTVSYDQYDEFREQYGHIFYNKKYAAYLLRFTYRFIGEQVKGGPGWALRNSGAMLQSPAPQTMLLHQDFPISLELQLLGGNGKDERHTGNLCTPGTNVVFNGGTFQGPTARTRNQKHTIVNSG